MAGRLALLKLEVLADALLDGWCWQGGPDAARRGDGGVRDLRVCLGVGVELRDDAFVQLAELTRHLAQVISLPPAL